ncbi:hypothetical protein PG993_003085 [Apiospora rasikravindrae]|uniref:2EXR domain-containing protein n=1 Tax=Apiospora rasikravindrae TaxID=990691 RepID=A0ABR1TYJ5_9PEZI
MVQQLIARSPSPMLSDAEKRLCFVEDGDRARERLVSAVRQDRDEEDQIQNLALNLSKFHKATHSLIKCLHDDIHQLKQDNADLRLGSRRFTCFNRLPTEIRTAIWELAAVETYTPKIFQANIKRVVRPDGIPEIGVRYPRHNVAQACRESRYLLHPVKPTDHVWDTMSKERQAVVKDGLDWGWNEIAGWPWFKSDLDGILFSATMLDSEEATGEESLKALEALVGPLHRILVPWREDPSGAGLRLGNDIFPKFRCLQHLRSLEFVMARRKVKRSVCSRWPILPFAVDVNDKVAVRDTLAALGPDDAEWFRRDVRYYAEPGYIEDGGPASYWGIFHTCIKEDWLLQHFKRDPPNGDDTPPVVDREVVSWDHPWVQEHLKLIPVFKRVILLE